MKVFDLFRKGLAVLAWGALATGPAIAQVWPQGRPVTLVVGTPAGGSTDVYARLLAEQLGKLTGTRFLVENKGGANGNLSADYVLRAPADGHMLWITTQSMMTINPSAYENLRWKQSDWVAIAKGVESPLVLVAHPSVPAKNVQELGAWATVNKGKASFASFSPGTPSHFLGVQLSERLKADMVHVPYKGSGPQVTDLLGGQVPLGFTQLQAALPHIQSGKLRALAVTSPTRSRLLPQVPTLAEQGMGDLTMSIWFGVAAHSATPKAIVGAIAEAVAKVQSNPAYRATLEAQGLDVSNEAGAAFAKSIATETSRWSQLVRATGFRAAD